MGNNYKTGVLITGDASGAVKSLKLTRQQLDNLNLSKKQGITVSKDYGRQISRVSGFLKTMIPVATLAGMGAMVKSTISAADSVDKMSTRIGASTEALSEYRYIAELTGVQFDALTMGWQRQVRRISEANQGYGEAKDALKELGLEASELVKLKPEEQFEAIAEAMQGVGNQSDRVRLAMRLWDSEGVKLLQTIDEGPEKLAAWRHEAREFGLSLSRDQVDAAVEAKESITRLTASFEGLRNELVLETAPALTATLDTLRRIAKSDSILQGISNEIGSAIHERFGEKIPTVLDITSNRINDLTGEVFKLRDVMAELEAAGKSGTAEYNAYAMKMEALNKRIERSRKLFDGLNGQVGKNTDMVDESTDSIEGNTAARQESNKEKEKELELFERLIFSADKELEKNYQFSRAMDDLHNQFIRGNIPTLEEYKRLVSELEKNTFNAKESTDAWAVAIASASVEVDGFADSWVKAGERIDETFADAWKGAFESAKEAMDGMVDGVKTTLAEMAHAAASRPILVSLGVLSGGGLDLSNLSVGERLTNAIGGNSIGTSLVNFGDSIGAGLLDNAGNYANWQYGAAGILGGVAGDRLFGGYGGAGGSLGATAGMAVGGPVGAVIGGLIGGAAGGLFGGDDTPRATYYNSAINAGFEDDVSVQSAFGYLGLRDQGSKNIKAAELRQSLESIAAIDDLIANTFGQDAVSNVRAALDGWSARDKKADDFMDRMFDRFSIIVQEIDFRFSDIAQLGAESLEEIATRLLTFKEISDFIDSNVVVDQAEYLADAAKTLRDRFNDSASAIYRLGDAYDGTTDATTELAGALTARYQLELQYLNQIQGVQQGLNDTIQGSIESIRLSVMDTQQQYDYFSDQAEALAASLDSLVDPSEINQVVNDINSLTNQAYNLLGGDQQAAVADEFVDFLEGVLGQANDQLDAERERAASESEALRDAMVAAMETGAERMAQRLETVAAQQQAAANTLASGASLFAQSLPVRVSVSYSGEFAGEVG